MGGKSHHLEVKLTGYFPPITSYYMGDKNAFGVTGDP
jgi:hypothetical protein